MTYKKTASWVSGGLHFIGEQKAHLLSVSITLMSSFPSPPKHGMHLSQWHQRSHSEAGAGAGAGASAGASAIIQAHCV